jgi:hypothetical protein
MNVETRDWRPGSMFERGALTIAAILAGMVTGTIGLAFLTLFILADIGGAVDAMLEEDAAEDAVEALEPEVIEAAFVQLGREFRPRELPDRAVATSSLAPQRPDRNLVSKRIVTPQERPDEPPPPNAYEDMLRQLGNTSRHVDSRFAAETEGDPNGNEEGRMSQNGSVYLGQLMALVKRGWHVPVTIPDSELVSLRAAVSFRITDDLRMVDVRLSVRSGNADYDRSIEQRIAEIRESSFRVPPPPPEERARFVGVPITFNMLPPPSVLRDARDRLDRAAGGSGNTDDALDRLGASSHGTNANEPAPSPEPPSAAEPPPEAAPAPPPPEPAPAPAE